MKIVIAQSEAKTTPTIPSRRHVCPSTSLGRLRPGLELALVRMGVDGRRPSRRRVLIIVSEEKSP
jgi:hypothetical protein